MRNLARFFLIFPAFVFCVCCTCAQQQTDASQNNQNPQNTNAQKDSGDKKPKKVWTDDDLHGLGGVSVVGDAKSNAKGHPSQNTGKDGASYKQQLAKLQTQLDDINKRLAELRSFNGENSKDTAIQTNHRISRGSISDQIAQLEAKKADITAQMQKIYDEARHNGIEPGALR